MRIIHRISISSNPTIQSELDKWGIEVAPQGLVSFEVDEGSDNWRYLKEWIIQRRAVDISLTKFSKKEIAHAHWLALVADWHLGYPQPNEDDFGYLQATYDLSNWCEKCGIGLKQKAPFQMKNEPKWGRRGILQLNWVFDEFFVTPEIWDTIFKPHGVESRPVIDDQGAELRTVVQLDVSEEVEILTSGLVADAGGCLECGRVKYLPHTRGFFPPLLCKPPSSLAKTKEYFGSGASAHKGVLVSQEIARALAANKVLGASLVPVEGVQ